MKYKDVSHFVSHFIEIIKKSSIQSNFYFFMEHPGGFEPSIIELQSIALPDLAKDAQ